MSAFVLEPRIWNRFQPIIANLPRSWTPAENATGSLLRQEGTLTFTISHSDHTADDIAIIKNILEGMMTPAPTSRYEAPEEAHALMSEADSVTTLAIHCPKLADFTDQFGLDEQDFAPKKNGKKWAAERAAHPPGTKEDITIDWPNLPCFKNKNGAGYFLQCKTLQETNAIVAEMTSRYIKRNVRTMRGNTPAYFIHIVPNDDQIEKLEKELGLPLSTAPSASQGQIRHAQ